MSQMNIEIPPPIVDPMLKDYLNRQFINVNLALGRSNYFEPRTNLPQRVDVGEVHYFTSAIPASPITDEGLWLYKSTGWVQLA